MCPTEYNTVVNTINNAWSRSRTCIRVLNGVSNCEATHHCMYYSKTHGLSQVSGLPFVPDLCDITTTSGGYHESTLPVRSRHHHFAKTSHGPAVRNTFRLIWLLFLRGATLQLPPDQRSVATCPDFVFLHLPM